MVTDKTILDRITRGTTDYRRRYDPKVVRVRHNEARFALVQWMGSSYSCNGPCYQSGNVKFVRLPIDLETIGGTCIWETGRDGHGTFTPKRLRLWLEVFRSMPVDQVINWTERNGHNREVFGFVRQQVIERCGRVVCRHEQCKTLGYVAPVGRLLCAMHQRRQDHDDQFRKRKVTR